MKRGAADHSQQRELVKLAQQLQETGDIALIKLLPKAWIARQALECASGQSISALAAGQNYSRDYFGVLLRIAYFAPDIVSAILDGSQPIQLNR